MGPLSMACLSAIEGITMRCTSFSVPNPKLPYTIVIDASGIAVGGVLMQDQGNGLWRLTFLSRWLKPTE